MTSAINSKHYASHEDEIAYAHMKEPVNISEYEGFFEIDEEKILSYWFKQEKNQEEKNDYDAILFRAKFFERHGLTARYYSNLTGTQIFVTSQEFTNGKFH
jgi:hypothetical protein